MRGALRGAAVAWVLSWSGPAATQGPPVDPAPPSQGSFAPVAPEATAPPSTQPVAPPATMQPVAPSPAMQPPPPRASPLAPPPGPAPSPGYTPAPYGYAPTPYNHATPPAPAPVVEPDEEEAPEPDWNLGAGIAASSQGLALPSSSLAFLSTPAFVFSFERRLGDATWLIFDGTFEYHSLQTGAFNAATDLRTTTILTLGGLAGIRQVVTTGAVDVSVWGALAVSHTKFGGDAFAPDESHTYPRPGTSSLAVGVHLGIALERELTEALAVRIGAELGRIQHTSDHIVGVNEDRTAESTADGSNWSARLLLRPSLQLRLYF